MTFQWAFHRDNLRREQCRSKCNLLANGSQQNAQNKAYSGLKQIVSANGKNFMFLPFECRDKKACFEQGSLLFGVEKFSLQDCPKILLHLFEEDTLLFLSVGKLWLKAVYQVVIFVSEICQFYVCQKSVK